MDPEIARHVIEETTIIVRQQLADRGAGHDFGHVERVLRLARSLQARIGGERLVVELAALLHDLGDAKFCQGTERSAEFARTILSDLKVEAELINHVVHIVDHLSFRKRHSAEPLSLEGQIVQDADRLDALGAIGIVRTIQYGASLGQPFDCPTSEETGIGHFQDKLLHLQTLMNTDIARRLAHDRTAFMKMFLDQYDREVNMMDE